LIEVAINFELKNISFRNCANVYLIPNCLNNSDIRSTILHLMRIQKVWEIWCMS